MDWIVDRIEGELAVVLVGELSVDLPLAALPPGVREGARLRLELRPAADPAAAAERQARLAAQSDLPDVIDL
ncbi:MAG: DUF3006 domain-containing protein [Deltaproteobacteria bacterium]|nr:DUF3006 domain-containing protein [Deltaproteobacteria bacterium]